MAQRHWLAKILMFLVLETGALVGVPMRPDQIEELTRILNQTAVVNVQRREDDGDGEPPTVPTTVR